MERVDVQVITYTPTVFYHCQHCELTFQHAGLGDRYHREQARDSLPPDLRDEFARVSEWVHGLAERHGRRVRVRVIDAASLEGVWKSFRYGLRRYPAVVVAGRERSVGTDLESLSPVVDGYVARANSS